MEFKFKFEIQTRSKMVKADGGRRPSANHAGARKPQPDSLTCRSRDSKAKSGV